MEARCKAHVAAKRASEEGKGASHVTPFMRYFLSLSDTSSKLLTQNMTSVDKFVAETNAATKTEQIVFTVKSHALKRLLAKDIGIKYKESANLYCEYRKDSDVFTVKRWQKRNNNASGTASKQQAANPEESKTATPAASQATVTPVVEETKILETPISSQSTTVEISSSQSSIATQEPSCSQQSEAFVGELKPTVSAEDQIEALF